MFKLSCIPFEKRYLNLNLNLPSADPFFQKLDILKIHDLFKLNLAKFVYNSLNKLNPTNFHSWFKLTSQIHNHNTRSKFIDIDNLKATNNLFIPTARTSNYGLKQLKVQGPNLWNGLPPVIRSIDLFIHFKK